MEIPHFRKVLEVLNLPTNLKACALALEGMALNYTSRVEVKDVVSWYLSGRPDVPSHVRQINELKKRTDGFIFAGRDTFIKVIKEFMESGKPVRYNKHNLKLNLNEVKHPNFQFKARMDGFSPKVDALREELLQKFQVEDTKNLNTRKTYTLLKFLPSGIDSNSLVQLLEQINFPNTQVRVDGAQVEICLEIEVAQGLDGEVTAYMNELLTEAKVEMNFQVSVETLNSLESILTGSKTLLESLCDGMQLKIEGDIWIDFLKTQIEMFSDFNMFGIGVLFLYGSSPVCAMCLNGNLNVKLDAAAVELMKTREQVQSLCFKPSELCSTD